MFLGGNRLRRRGGELGGGHRLLEPMEQVAIEATVQLLGVQCVQPGVQQAVEVVRLAVAVYPEQPLPKRQISQYVQVRPVRVGSVNLTDQRNAT